ncbi:RND transporter [Thermotoga sp. RQ7]|uniref:efflux RND transporter permease subunit n=1 Tax=Thermotoga sp. RQ7 TaxID=126738 RepID=UPI0005A33375|nr:MMPL family transporter [Thermotoga sp. RQ7]AJG39963.1 RND transporter [Thermotoga sp. RQ7]
MKKYVFTIVYVVLVIASFVVVFSLGKIETGPEVFLPGYNGDPEKTTNENVKNLFRLNRDFGGSSSIVIVVESSESFFKDAQALYDLHEELARKSYISSVMSPVNLPRFSGFRVESYFENGAVSEDILKDPSSESFITKDGKYALLNVIFKKDVNAREKIPEIKSVVSRYFEKNYLFGEPVLDSALFKELVKQTLVYPVFMFLVIFLLFYYQLRSFRAALFSLIVPVLSTFFVFAVFFAVGKTLNTMTVMTISFLLIIGSAYGLHFYNALFRFEDRKEAIRHIFKPILFSMLTTAAGFMSFIFIDIRAFRELGILVSSGLAVVVLVIFTSGVELFRDYSPKRLPRNFGMKYVGRKAATVALIVFLIVAGLSPFLLPRVPVGSDMVSYFSKNSELVKAYDLIVDKFNMREPLYLVLEKDSSFVGTDSKTIRELVEKIEQSGYVSSVVFPVDIPVPIMYALSRANPFLKTFVGDRNRIRLIVNLTPEGYEHAKEVVKQINEIVEGTGWNHYVAGSVLIWNDINDSILRSQVQSIALASIMIFGMVFAIFRKLLSALSVMAPIAFTTVFNFIFMVFFGINLDVSTSITSGILMGLVIDYSIHIASEEQRLKDPYLVIENVGPSVLTNALGLIAGFAVLLFSELALFKNISILMMLGIGVGATFTLIVQPLILQGKKTGTS